MNQEAVSELKKQGLLVQFQETGPFANGYIIAKPKSTLGNKREDSEFVLNITTEVGRDKILCDGPSTRLYPKDGKWIFELWEFMPGPGPGDFRVEFASITDAVSAILDYYFGDPSKMNPPELLEYESNYGED